MPNRLVAIGDSLTQGFMNGSIFRTQMSYPVMLAQSLGETNFRVPDFSGEGGLPVNLEVLFHTLAKRYGSRIETSDFVSAFMTAQGFLDRVEDYWERGEGTKPIQTGPMHHNLAVWGFQLGDCDTVTEAICRRTIPLPRDNTVNQIPEFSMYRTARRTLNPSFSPEYENLSQLDVALQIAKANGGIENLIFWLGLHNCLGTVTEMKLKWSEEDDLNRLPHQRNLTLWRPTHFKQLLSRVAAKIDAIKAQNVFVVTIPHVTIFPICRGMSPDAPAREKLSDDGYYDYYTYFWVWDQDFAKTPHKYPHLTRQQVRTIDATINEYNEAIKSEANQRGWHVVDICNMFDRLAYRRQKGKPRYVFPPELVAAFEAHPVTKNRFTPDGKPILDTRYLRIDLNRIQTTDEQYRGGIFSLDGIHPTTIGYALIAYEFLQVMAQVLSVKPRPLNWLKVIEADLLIKNPPQNLHNLREILHFLNSRTPLANLIKVISGLNP